MDAMKTSGAVGRSGGAGRWTFLATLVLMLAGWGTTRAQFSKLSWTLVGDPNGSGTLSDTAMHVLGSDAGFCAGTPPGVTYYRTQAQFDATIDVHVVFDNQDTGPSYWHFEHPVFVRNGVITVIDPFGSDNTSFDFEDDFSFQVEAGDEFGFGIWSVDCSYGPSVVDLTNFHYAPVGWADAGFGLPGTLGAPILTGFGTLVPGGLLKVQLDQALPGAASNLVLGFSPAFVPFKGGVLVPNPSAAGLVLPLVAGPLGRIVLVANWPVGVPPGLVLWLQYWIADPAGPAGFSASNALAVETL